MAQLMVFIDLPQDVTYEDAREAMNKGGVVRGVRFARSVAIVDEVLLNRSAEDDSFFVFRVIGVRP